MSTALAIPGAAPAKPQVLPFAYGTSRKIVNVGTVPFAAGATPAPLRLPKSGFLSAIKFAFAGTVTVGTAGAATTPAPWQLISGYTLTANLGFQYRSLAGDRLYMKQQLEGVATDPVVSAKTFRNYNPASASAQSVNFLLTDLVALNRGLNFDKFMVSCQTLDQDTFIQLQFGGLSSVLGVGGTEVISAITGNIQVTAEFYTVPVTSEYALPDTSVVRQVLEDASYSGSLVIAGENLINLTPIQGPEYLFIAFKVVINGVPDTVDFASQVSRVRIFANATDPILDMTGQELIALMYDHYRRALPAGWFVINLQDDVGMINAVGPVERLALSTQEYSQLQLDVTLTGTVTGTSSITVLKSLQSEVAA